MVAAKIAAEPKEIPMTKAKPKRKTTARLTGDKTKDRNSTARTSARKGEKLKLRPQPLTDKRPQSSAQQDGNLGSKQARIIAMLRTPNGATIEAMADAMEWQPHSVRGFLAGVVRKKFGLNLVSAAAKSGRIYRIADQKPSSGATAKSAKAA